MNATQRFQTRFAELSARGQRVVLATVVECPPPRGDARSLSPRRGAKMVVGERGRLLGSIDDGPVEARAIAVARAMLHSKRPPLPQLVEVAPPEPAGGTVKVFFEAHNARPWRVYVFGAGHVGQRLTRALLLMDCEVTCVDSRREWVELLPASIGLERLCRAEPAQLVKRMDGDEFVVCATMGPETDLPILEEVFRQGHSLPYLGVVGDKEKRKRLAQSLVEAGVPKESAVSVRCPAGIALTAREPGEIAIAIAAEMIQARERQLTEA